jgi:hypothetical protein
VGLQLHSLSDLANVAAGLTGVLWVPYETFRQIDDRLLRDISARCVLIVSGGDEVLPGGRLQPLALVAADYYVVYDTNMLAAWDAALGSRLLFLPEGYIPEQHTRTDRLTRVLYIGSPFAGRIAILKKLQESGLAVDIYGPRSWEQTELRQNYKGFLDNNDYYRTIHRYKIFAALSSGDTPFDTHPNAKVGDGLRARTIVLTEYAQVVSNDFSSAAPAIRSAVDMAEMVRYAKEIIGMPEVEYEEVVDKALAQSAPTAINYLVSFRNILSRPLSKYSATSEEPVSLSALLRLLVSLRLIRIDSSILAKLATICGMPPAAGLMKIYIGFRLHLFTGGKYVPSRLSCFVYCPKRRRLSIDLLPGRKRAGMAPDVKMITVC